MRQAARKLRDAAVQRVGASALVLTYHRVIDLAFDPQLLAVSPDHFAAQMRLLCERCRVVPLGELMAAVRERRLAPGTVAVTFDDGYADNLENAAPVLAASAVPATVFVSSGCIEAGREFWWDELERLVLGDWPLPDEIALEVPGITFSARVDALADAPADPRWNVLEPDATAREHLYRELNAFLRPLGFSQRADALAQLGAQLHAEPEVRAAHRPLTPAEVAQIDAAPFVEIGAHSRNHDVLALLAPAEQTDAVRSDKAALEALCGRSIETFSYPFGGRSDFSLTTEDIVKDAGFLGACANYPGLVKPWTDPYRLPRHVVRNWDEVTFAARLQEWLGAPAAETGRR